MKLCLFTFTVFFAVTGLAKDHFIVVNPLGYLMEAHENGQTKILADNVTKVFFVPSGWYVFSRTNGWNRNSWRSGTNGWYLGNIMSTNPPVEIDPARVPPNVEEGTPSNDGKYVAWLRADYAAHTNAIIVTQMTGKPDICWCRNANGDTRGLAWSPDNTKLAFYHTSGEPSRAQDYSLLLMNLKSNKKFSVEEIAPPSLWINLNPRREPPEWSPSGNRILFNARYTPKWDVLYVVSLKDRKSVLLAQATVNSQDADYLWLQWKQTDRETIIKDSFAKDDRLSEHWECLYANQRNNLFVISSENRDMFLSDSTTKQMTKLPCKRDATGKVYWLGSREP